MPPAAASDTTGRIIVSRANIDDIERKVRASYLNDGVTLIVAGLSLAFMAIFFYSQRQTWATTFAVGVWAWLAHSLRRRLVYPRLGYAKLPPDKSKAKAPIAILTVVAVFIGAAAVARSPYDWLGPVYWAVMLTAAALLIGLTSRSKMALALSPVFLISGGVGLWLSSLGVCCSCAFQFWGLAAILIAIGLTQLALLQRRHPALAEEGLDDDAR
jgi:hypothetical protein